MSTFLKTIFVVVILMIVTSQVRCLFPDDDLLHFFQEHMKLVQSLFQKCPEWSKHHVKYRICVASHDTRNTPYIDKFRVRNEHYCKQEDIDFKFYGEDAHKDIPIHWRKMFIVQDNLPMYDYVIWIDSDAHFTGKHSIRDLIQIYDGQNVTMMVSTESAKIHKVMSFLNAGFFIAKRSQLDCYNEMMKEFELDGCWQGTKSIKGLWARYCYEQGAINRMHLRFPDKFVPIKRCHVTPNQIGPQTIVVHYALVDKNNFDLP
jgi:hypothetical protein